MKTRSIDVPEDLLDLLRKSRLGARSESDLVRLGLSILLLRSGDISMGRAAELAGEPRSSFELLLGELGLSPVRYDVADYEQDLEGIAAAKRRAGER